MDYANTVIYKIVCKNQDISDIYIGHTADLNSRRTTHERTCRCSNRKGHNYKVYKFIRDNGGFDNFHMEIIEHFPCDSMKEACRREGYWTKRLGATLNDKIPGRTKCEYYIDNQVQILQKSHTYYHTNKVAITEQKRTAVKIPCSCGGYYKPHRKCRHFKTMRHQAYITSIEPDTEYEYYWEDGTKCSKEDYENSN